MNAIYYPNTGAFLLTLSVAYAFGILYALVFRLTVWRSGKALVSINELNLLRARLVLGWVTVSGVQLPVRENLSQYI